jgi:hypothetical protein
MAGIMLKSGRNRPIKGLWQDGYAQARKVGCPMMRQNEGGRDVGMKKWSFMAGRRAKLGFVRNFFMFRLLTRMESLRN